jgi:hypothetical protein
MTKTPAQIRKFLTDTFGDFDEFKNEFFKIKHGTLPPGAHPHPRTTAKIQKLKEWPYSFTELKDLYAICYVCQQRGMFAGCKFSPKVIADECRGLNQEAHREEMRLMEIDRNKMRKHKKNKGKGKTKPKKRR